MLRKSKGKSKEIHFAKERTLPNVICFEIFLLHVRFLLRKISLHFLTVCQIDFLKVLLRNIAVIRKASHLLNVIIAEYRLSECRQNGIF